MIKTALITGSSRGIGKAIAIRLAKSGFRILLHGSCESESLSNTERELKLLTNHLQAVHFDVSNNTEVETGCKAILKEFGAIDVLVNNAGISKDKTLSNMSEQEWDEVIKTNLYGPFYVIRQLLSTMKEHEYGRIINMSSIAAERGAFGKTNYAAAKAGLIGLTKSLAQEVGKYHITVNAVCPGYIDTDMSAQIPEKYRSQWESEIALKRRGSPEEVADVVHFLASKESSYISGAVLSVNGGWL